MDSGNDRGAAGLGRVLVGVQVVRHLGVSWVLFRLRHGAERRLGLLKRRMPVRPWSSVPVKALTLVREALLPMANAIGANVVSEADAVVAGRFPIFSGREVSPGVPPDWSANVLGGEPALRNAHWTDALSDYRSDIKGVWELSRFSWAYSLARAYAKTGDSRYSECFWRLFEDWCATNQPNRGANWACGQEATFRLMGVVFAAEVFGTEGKDKVVREILLSKFVWATAERIDGNLAYALSQKNNHGVSECVGLITAALLLGTQEKQAGVWLRRGMAGLERQLAELVYQDGSFSQHSLIYHRVLLHDLIWCCRRLQAAGQEVPQWLDGAGRKATEFLASITDPSTGRAPLFGANDGADVLPLAEGDFLDMRPVIHAGWARFRSERLLPEGAWDEEVRWMRPGFDGLPAAAWPGAQPSWHAKEGGYLQLASGAGRLLLRCPVKFSHRPSQADSLSVSVGWHGRQVVLDAGSYSYGPTENLGKALKSAALHNVLTVDGVEPMGLHGRFLYLPWLNGSVQSDGQGWTASHDGYEKLGVSWSRRVSSSAPDVFEVQDSVASAHRHRYRLHWLLVDAAWVVSVDKRSISATIDGRLCSLRWDGAVGVTCSTIRADREKGYGWWSPTYGEIQPVVSLLIEWEGKGNFALTTTLSVAEA